MSGAIYLIQGDDRLVPMTEQAYESEDLLQGLLAKYPNLLAGDQIDSVEPRRWLLVSREAGLPSEEEGADRWSVDHLFLDQDGIPTLVEVKRSADTRIRREVVGQMLDYAANAVVYWPVERVQSLFESNCSAEGRDPDSALAELLDVGATAEGFWEKVGTNLQAGRIRMVFVADRIPPELQRIVEFLNGQMKTAEVLAVEVKQYAGQGLTSLVPRVVGQTSDAKRARPASGTTPAKRWDETSFFEALESARGQQEAAAAGRVLEWAKLARLAIRWGRGKQYGTWSPVLDHREARYQIIQVWASGDIEFWFGALRSKPPFDDDSRRTELLRRLNQVPGINLPPDAINHYPSVSLSVLTDESALAQFLDALDWAVAEIRSF